jgi:N-acetylneuraminic acid mutarotase
MAQQAVILFVFGLQRLATQPVRCPLARQSSLRVMKKYLAFAFAFFFWSLQLNLSAHADEPGTWGRLAPIPNRLGVAGPIAGTDGSSLIVAGGANFPDAPPWQGGKKVWHDRVYVLSDPDAQWRDTGTLARPIGYAVCVSIPEGKGLGPGVAYFGGSDESRHYDEGWLLKWNEGRLEQSALPALPRQCAQGCGALVGNTIYIAGGIETPNATVAMHQFWGLELDKRPLIWKELETWPGPARMLSVAASHDDAFYLCSGVKLSAGPDGKPVRTYLRDAYCYRPQKGWLRVADLPRAAAAAPSPALNISQPDRKNSGFMILGGDDGCLADFRPLDQHPGFPKSILSYDTKTDSWRSLGEQPASHVTTSTVHWRDRLLIPSGEVRPGVRSAEVLFLTGELRSP